MTTTTTTAAALDVVEAWRDATLDAITSGLADPSTVVDGLADTRVRDCLLWLATTDAPGLDVATLDALALSAGRHLVESIPSGILRAAPALTVAALTAWLDGRADDARSLLTAVRVIDPTYSLADLLDRSLAAELPASTWAASMTGLTFDQCRHGA